MPEEYHSIFLTAKTLQKAGENLSPAELANRLANTIIETVERHKAERWEMTKMDFLAGDVTIYFKRPILPDPLKPRY